MGRGKTLRALLLVAAVGAIAFLAALSFRGEPNRDGLGGLPPVDRTAVAKVRDLGEWKNPFVLVHCDRAELRGVGDVQFDRLEEALAALPRSAWPYGRIVAVAGESIVPEPWPPHCAARLGETIAALKRLGLEVDPWPS